MFDQDPSAYWQASSMTSQSRQPPQQRVMGNQQQIQQQQHLPQRPQQPRPPSASLRPFSSSTVSLQPIRPPQWTAKPTAISQRGRKLRDPSASNPAFARCVVGRHLQSDAPNRPLWPNKPTPAATVATTAPQAPFIQAGDDVFYRQVQQEDNNDVDDFNNQYAGGMAEAPRNDLQGGSGVGLGSYQLPSEQQQQGQKRGRYSNGPADDDDQNEETQSSSQPTRKRASRPKAAARKAYKANTTTYTKKKKSGGWKKGGRRQRKGGGGYKRKGSTASSNRKSYGNRRRSGATTSDDDGGGDGGGWSSTMPAASAMSALPISRQDPLLSNVGGAEITF